MFGVLAYLAYLKGVQAVAESSQRRRARAFNNRMDAWYASHGFPSFEIQEQIRRYVWNNRAKVYEEMTGKPYFEHYFNTVVNRQMEKYETEKRGYKYFLSCEWWNDPGYKAANKF